jgi:TolB-like protein/Flp pilus assembly protein TadD
MNFFQELKRRNVFRVTIAYAVAAWVLLQVADLVLEATEAPSWVLQVLMLVIGLGFIAATVVAWAYELTPEGVKKESAVARSESIAGHTGRKLDRIIIAFLVVAVAILFYRQSGTQPVATPVSPEPIVEQTAAADEPTESSDKSIAVLPFTTRSTSEDDKYFSDGMHDDLLTQLAKIGSLKVISRTSMMEYRETTKNLKQIGQELGVANILEGAVQRVGKQVRINVQLIDADTDEHLWAETYDREMSLDNLLSIQSEMSRSIAQAMHATLSPQEAALIDRRLTGNIEALEAYRRAKSFSRSFTGDLDRAELELKQALELDPEFAAAWAQLAFVYLSKYWGIDQLDTYRVQAREAIDQGRAIDPNLPELDIAEGYYYYWGFLDYPAALEVLEPLLEIYPNDVDLTQVLAYVNRRFGRFDTSLEYMFRAVALAPRDQRLLFALGETYAALRQFDIARIYLDKIISIDAGDPRAEQLRGSILAGNDGDFMAAARSYQLASIDLRFMEWEVWATLVLSGDYDASLAFLAAKKEKGLPGWKSSGQFDAVPVLTALTMHYADDPAATPALNEARIKLATALDASPQEYELNMLNCQVTGALKDPGNVKACEAALETKYDDAFDNPWQITTIAQGFALGGQSERALDILQDVLESPVGPTKIVLAANPAFRSLHATNRWQELMK